MSVIYLNWQSSLEKLIITQSSNLPPIIKPEWSMQFSQEPYSETDESIPCAMNFLKYSF
jgi:hypothetical protein